MGLGQAITANIVRGKIVIREGMVRIKLDRFLRFLRRLFEFAEGKGKASGQECMRLHVARISLSPQLTGLVRLFQVSPHQSMIGKIDKELLLVTCAIPQLPRFTGAIHRQFKLSDVVVHAPEPSVRRCELGVDLSSAFE